jgi:predicted dehydrogenase
MHRRDFLSHTSAAATATLGAAAVFADDTKPLRVGLIGTGWYGKCDLFRLIQVAPVDVVSLCDVDAKLLDEAADMVATRQKSKKKPRTYGDYRKMLAEKNLDIVLVDTPDHWHALPTIAALEAGAHVYVQKPISVDVSEGRAMLAAARKHKKVVQVGTQRRSTPHLIEARNDIVKAGKLGTIAHVEVYCYYHMRANEKVTALKPPEHLDWEMWTGPAPKRDFNRLVHPRRWRAFMEYGNGIMGDMCIHMLDMVRWTLDLGWPKRISSTGGILVQKDSSSNITDTQTATFEFPNLSVNWTHRTWGEAPDPKYPWGATIYGDKGTLKMSVNSYTFTPYGGGKPIHRDVKLELEEYPEDKTEKDLEKHVAPAIRGHMRDFLAAIAKGTKPVADIEQGHISSASCILANLSQELGRTLHYDPEKHEVIGDAEATKRLTRPYRGPWKHPGE